jgi:membrane-bound metal-dependent hydrolase YbcI (DUF457 family)
MTYGGHVAAGGIPAAFIVTRGGQLTPEDGPIVALVWLTAVFASLAPDLDHPDSWLGRRLLPLVILFRVSLSNPLTWFVFGGDDKRRKPGLLTTLLAPFRYLAGGRRRMRSFVRHRGFTHTAWALGFFGLLVPAVIYMELQVIQAMGFETARFAPASGWLATSGLVDAHGQITLLLGTAFFLGYLSHILCDMMTVSGVQLFHPRSKRRFHLVPAPFRLRVGD